MICGAAQIHKTMGTFVRNKGAHIGQFIENSLIMYLAEYYSYSSGIIPFPFEVVLNLIVTVSPSRIPFLPVNPGNMTNL